MLHLIAVLVFIRNISVSWVWLIKWGTLSLCSFPLSGAPSLSVLCFVEKTRSPAACCRYFWGMWSLERQSPTNASLRWRETPERRGRWEGPWGGTRWVWLTLIDKLLSCLLYFVSFIFFIRLKRLLNLRVCFNSNMPVVGFFYNINISWQRKEIYETVLKNPWHHYIEL